MQARGLCQPAGFSKADGGRAPQPITGSRRGQRGQLICAAWCAVPACASHLQSGIGPSLPDQPEDRPPNKCSKGRPREGPQPPRSPRPPTQGLHGGLAPARQPGSPPSTAHCSSRQVSTPGKGRSLGHVKRSRGANREELHLRRELVLRGPAGVAGARPGASGSGRPA